MKKQILLGIKGINTAGQAQHPAPLAPAAVKLLLRSIKGGVLNLFCSSSLGHAEASFRAALARLPIAAAFLVLALVSCGKNAGSKTNTLSAAGNGGSGAGELIAPKWKVIYLGELLAAQEYSAVADFENHDSESMYPLFLYAAYLIDLNFDGTPELLLFGPPTRDGAQAMHIFTINGDGVQLIYRGWGDMDAFKLYRKAGSNSQAFTFKSARWDMTSWIGAYYLTNADTKIDRDFSLDAIFARFSERYDFDDDGNEFDTAYTFNSKEVSQTDYNRLIDNMFAGYEELPYRPVGMIWDSEGYGITFSITLLSPVEIMLFMDSFDEEDGMGEPGYDPE